MRRFSRRIAGALLVICGVGAALGQGSAQLRSVRSVDELLLRSPVPGQAVLVTGRNQPGDSGAARLFTLTNTIPGATNMAHFFRIPGSTNYLISADWNAIPQDVRWFGAKGDGLTDDSAAIQAAMDYVAALSSFGGGTKKRLLLPNGQFVVRTSLTLTNPVALIGEAIEGNSVNTYEYPLVGSVIVSQIVGGGPVLRVVSTDAGDGNTYQQGIEIRDIGIDGSGTDGSGIEFIGNSNFTDVILERIRVRNVGGSAFKVGDGTLGGSPRFGYMSWRDLSAIKPGKDGFEVYNESFYDVGVLAEKLYVNGAGRSSFRFWNVGGFLGSLWVENNSGQHEEGHGFDFLNVHGATMMNCVAEGNGRNDDSGSSYAPVTESLALSARGMQNCKWINCIFTASAGRSGTNDAGVVEMISSVSTNGFGARESVNNTFEMCRVNSFSPPLSAPTGAFAAGTSVQAGMHRYRVTAVYSGGWETPLSSGGELAMVSTNATNIVLSAIPTAGALGSETCGARKVYRTKADGVTFFLLTTINDNTTTTFADSTSDASLLTTAQHRFLIKLDAEADLNQFTNCRFDVMPLVNDAGQWNYWDRWYIATIAPDTMLGTGHGTWGTGPASGTQGLLHMLGADDTGGRRGWGITPGIRHSATLAIPGASASRWNEPIALISGDGSSDSNVVAMGRGGWGVYAPAQVELWSASSSSLTTTSSVRHVTLTSTGPLFNSPPAVENNEAYQLLDSGGTRRNGISIDSGDTLQLGYNGGRINIASGTGGTYLGGVGYSSPIYIVRSGIATGGDTLKNSQLLGFIGSYWTGVFESQLSGDMRLSVDSTAPTYSFKWKLGSTDRMSLSDTGTLTVSNLIVTGSETIGGVARSSWPSGGGGGTNASTVFVNNASQVDGPSFNDSAELAYSVASGTDITLQVVANSIGTNKVSSGFHSWVNGIKGVAVDAGTALRLEDSGEILFAMVGATSAIAGYVDRSVEMIKLGTNGTAAGDLLVRAADRWTNKAKGSDGQVLTMVSGSVDWAIPSGGGGGGVNVDAASISPANLTSNWLGRFVVSGTSNITFVPSPAKASQGTTITPDFSVSAVQRITLTNHITLAAPTGVTSQMIDAPFRLVFIQDAVGGWRVTNTASEYRFGSYVTEFWPATNASSRSYYGLLVSATNAFDVTSESPGFQ